MWTLAEMRLRLSVGYNFLKTYTTYRNVVRLAMACISLWYLIIYRIYSLIVRGESFFKDGYLNLYAFILVLILSIPAKLHLDAKRRNLMLYNINIFNRIHNLLIPLLSYEYADHLTARERMTLEKVALCLNSNLQPATKVYLLAITLESTRSNNLLELQEELSRGMARIQALGLQIYN